MAHILIAYQFAPESKSVVTVPVVAAVAAVVHVVHQDDLVAMAPAVIQVRTVVTAAAVWKGISAVTATV